jgi:hypothetical protein
MAERTSVLEKTKEEPKRTLCEAEYQSNDLASVTP